jgi:hypothetical protein
MSKPARCARLSTHNDMYNRYVMLLLLLLYRSLKFDVILMSEAEGHLTQFCCTV